MKVGYYTKASFYDNDREMLVFKPMFQLVLCAVALAALNPVFAADRDAFLAKIKSDKRDIESYIGLASLELAENNLEAAMKTQKRGLRYAKQNDDKLALRTLGVQIERAARNAKRALSQYKRGVRVKTSSSYPALHYAMAEVYFDNRNFPEAREMLGLSLAADAMNNERAEAMLAHVQQIERAVAITQSNFAYSASINRAEIARLLNRDLKMSEYIPQPEAESVGETSDQGLTDYADSEYSSDILASHRLNFRSFRITNGAFNPSKSMTRGELAMLVEDILYAKYQVSRTAFIGTASPFSDLKSNATSFNAVMSAVTRGLMQGREDGTIGPDDLVSGAESILVLHNLKQILQREA